MTILRCFIIDAEGKEYHATQLEDKDKIIPKEGIVFRSIIKENGEVLHLDLREKPPYFQLLPCPYCEVEEDRSHDPLKHVNPKMGTPIAHGD